MENKREIKFRAWNAFTKKMFEWSYFVTAHHLLFTDSFRWMQFTGLKDKNGKEIYEGDIVEYSFAINENEDEQGRAAIIYDNGSYFLDEWFIHMIDEFKIIGNIYENKELIEDGK